MEKITLNLAQPEQEEFSFNKQLIKVDPYITVGNKYILLSNYMEGLFKESDEEGNVLDVTGKYITSEHALILGILDLCTNINIENLDLDIVFATGLWDEVKSHIKNYNDIRSDIARLVSQHNQDASVGVVLDKISEKISATLDKLSELDISEEGIAKLFKEFNRVVDDADKKYTMKPKAPSTRKKKTE